MLEKLDVRKAISKLRLSAHNLLIETGRYAKLRSLPRSERISEPGFYGDLVYKFRKIIDKNDFPYHFKKDNCSL